MAVDAADFFDLDEEAENLFDLDDPVEPVDFDAGASVVVVVEPQHRVPQSVAAAFFDLDGHVTDVVPAEDCSFRRKRAIRSTKLPTTFECMGPGIGEAPVGRPHHACAG